MDTWIWVAAAGGVLCAAGLVTAVVQYCRGWLHVAELLILIVGTLAVVSVAVAGAASGTRASGWAELAVWLLIGSALVINARRRRRQARSTDRPKDEAA